MKNLELPGSFGDWLKARRRALDLPQEELAGRVGCSIFALRKIESGEHRPSRQLAGLLAAALEAEKHLGSEPLLGIRKKQLEQSLETIMNGLTSSQKCVSAVMTKYQIGK